MYAAKLGDKDHHHGYTKKPGQSLGSILGLPLEKSGEKRTFFLFRCPVQASSRSLECAGMELANADSVISTGDGPVYFLGTFSSTESAAFLKGLFKGARDSILAKKLLLATAIHPDHDIVVPFLIAVAKRDARPKIRYKAVFWLGLHPTSRAVRFLEALLNADREGKIGKQAVESLGLNRHARATAVLLDHAEHGSRESTRGDALFWLSNKVRQVILKGAKKHVNDSEAAKTKSTALTALALSPGKSTGEKLAELARSAADPRIKAEAIFWMAQRKDQRVLPIMREILSPPA